MASPRSQLHHPGQIPTLERELPKQNIEILEDTLLNLSKTCVRQLLSGPRDDVSDWRSLCQGATFSLMKRGLVLGVVLAVLMTGSAQAHTTIIESTDSHMPYQQWVDEANVPTPDVTVTVIEASTESPEWSCSGIDYGVAPACVVLEERTIYIDPTKVAPVGREFFFHELAHIFDPLVLSDQERERFAAILRLPMPWWYPTEIWHQAPAEYFAGMFSQCAIRGPRIPEFVRLLRPNGTTINQRQKFQICTLISRAYLRTL